jgi:polyphosphate kinase
VIRTRDLLVHHPYQSFAKTVERFLLEAVEDPDVLAIKMTLYRTGSQSPFVPLLIRAAEAGKQVVALVELKARFDEERNIRVARQLERAGVHVVYGVVGYKTHCKMALVVRREADQIRSYVHLGTGNYHPKTSQVYTDLGLFTADPEICKDVVELFHFLTGRSLKRNYRKLLVAPVSLKEHLVFMIRREIDATKSGRPARIIAKMNGLDDPEVISALRKAAIAGVRIDLIVRGTCCLGPQDLPAVAASNLRIVSILGRFLEHSRVVYFQNSATDELGGEFYIGSADWMRRNLNSRVECLIPVRDAIARSELWDFLQLLLADRRQAWELDRLGKYVRLQPETSDQNLGVHERLMRTFKRQSQSKLLDSDSPEFPTWASVPRLDSHLSI